MTPADKKQAAVEVTKAILSRMDDKALAKAFKSLSASPAFTHSMKSSKKMKAQLESAKKNLSDNKLNDI